MQDHEHRDQLDRHQPPFEQRFRAERVLGRQVHEPHRVCGVGSYLPQGAGGVLRQTE